MEFPVIKFDVHGVFLSVMDFPKTLEGWVAFQIAAAASTRCKHKTALLEMLAKDAELIIRSVKRGSPPQTPDEVYESLDLHTPEMPLSVKTPEMQTPQELWAAGTWCQQGAVVNVVCGDRDQAIKHCKNRLDFIQVVHFGKPFSETDSRFYPLAKCEVRKAYPEAEPQQDSAAVTSAWISPARQVALDWVGKEQLPEVGFVVFWEGKAIGWERELCRPSKLRPGAVVVSVTAPIVKRAAGGDDKAGAKLWVDVSEDFAYGDDEIAKGGAV